LWNHTYVDQFFILHLIMKRGYDSMNGGGKGKGKGGEAQWIMLVPAQSSGAIIGPKGARIKEIQQMSGATVDVEKDVDWGVSEKMVTIKGDSEQKMEGAKEVMKAVFNISEDEGYKQSMHFLVPPQSVPLIVGQRGAQIKELQEDTGTSIDLSKDPGSAGMCQITGTLDAIVACAKRVFEIVGSDRGGPQGGGGMGMGGYGGGYGGGMSMAPLMGKGKKGGMKGGMNGGFGMGGGKGMNGGFGMGGGATFGMGNGMGNGGGYGGDGYGEIDWNLVVPSVVSPALIGPRGAVVNEIQQQSGARIDIPKNAEGEDKCVIIKGNQQSKGIAMDCMLHKLASTREFTESGSMPPIRFQIPAHAASSIIGQGGSNVKMISQQSGCQIRCTDGSDSSNRYVTLAGDVDSIVMAAGLIFPMCAQ